MKYLVNIKTKEILKEAKSIGQAWVDTQSDLELLDLDDVVLEDGTFRTLTDTDILPVLSKVTLKQITTLEQSLLRPMRELLSNNTSQADKDIAQSRVNQVEIEIQALRTKLTKGK